MNINVCIMTLDRKQCRVKAWAVWAVAAQGPLLTEGLQRLQNVTSFLNAEWKYKYAESYLCKWLS